ACTGVDNQACYLDTGSNATVTFGPNVTGGRVGFGSYRAKLVVKDDSNVENACAAASPYSTSCIDDPEAASAQRWWTDVKINSPPQGVLRIPTGTFCCTSGLREAARRTDIGFAPAAPPDANPVTDPDGTVASYQWSIVKVSGGAPAPLVGTPNLAVAAPTVQFREPDKDYQARATLRVTDNNGGFADLSTTFWVRNRNPVAGITSINSQSQANGLGPAIRSWVGEVPAPTPLSARPIFRFDAGPSSDIDGGVQSRLWRIWRVAANGTRTQLAEFGDNNSGGTTCQINTGLPESPISPLPQASCFVFDYLFSGYGKYAVDLEVLDNDGAKNRTEIEIKINRPPTVQLTVNPTNGVLNASGTSGPFSFTPNVAALGDGGAITNYRLYWGNGQNGTDPFNDSSSTAPRTRTYDTALNNSDGSPATTTGTRGTWVVRLAVTDTDQGVTVVQRTIRINQRPIARLFAFGTTAVAPSTPFPVVRLNCPADPTDAAFGLCQLPAWDASPSTDPDTSQPLTEYRWYGQNFVLADPNLNLIATSGSPT
ncbi:MAG: hypothetical protein ACOYOQ_16670, partial [Microthrixaceae bacterium]